MTPPANAATARDGPAHGPGIRLFLDSADRAAWSAWLDTGLFHGITTNPQLLAAAGLPCRLPDIASLVRDALDRGIPEIQVQTWGTRADRLIENGCRLAAIDRRVVVKVPVTRDGVAAATRLHALGIRTTLTALYCAHQALVAAAAAADYAAPYLGRITDAGRDGHAEVIAMQEILRATGSRTRLLVASIRKAEDMAQLAARGVDTFTFAPRIAEELFGDPKTASAAAGFEAAALGPDSGESGTKG